MSERPTLLVFLKYPEPGRVKTRLAQTIGPERAAALYGQWIGTVFQGFQVLRPAIRLSDIRRRERTGIRGVVRTGR